MSESEEIFETTTQAIFKSSAPPILVGGEGNILPCVELCNINFNFQAQDKFTISNQNGRLYIETDEGLSSKSTMFPCYTSIDVCSEANTPSDKLYTLQDIIITCPSLHRMYVNGSSTIFDGEIYIVFKNTYNNNTTYKVLAILLTQTSSMSLAVTNNCLNAYKLFESLATGLPNKDEETTVSSIADWEINDLLPSNKWFYNYTHPNNTNVNWYVYKNPIYVPNTFKTNFISTVSQVTSGGNIQTGTTAYNTLYSTISKLQNPITSDNSFVIFEQRDLSALSSGSGTTSSSSSNLNNANSVAACQALLSESSEENVGYSSSGTSGGYSSTSGTTGGSSSSNTSTSSSSNNYSTGSTSEFFSEEEGNEDNDDDEYDKQISNENKAWSIFILVINILYFIGVVTLIVFTFIKRNVLRSLLSDLMNKKSYNLIFFLALLLIPFMIWSSVYLSYGISGSGVAIANIAFISLNYIIYIALVIVIIIQSIKISKGIGAQELFIGNLSEKQNQLEKLQNDIKRMKQSNKILSKKDINEGLMERNSNLSE